MHKLQIAFTNLDIRKGLCTLKHIFDRIVYVRIKTEQKHPCSGRKCSPIYHRPTTHGHLPSSPVHKKPTQCPAATSGWPKSKHHPCPFQRCRRTSGRRTTDCKGWGGGVFCSFYTSENLKKILCSTKNLCLRWITYNESNSGPFFGEKTQKCEAFMLLLCLSWQHTVECFLCLLTFYSEFFTWSTLSFLL